MDVNRDAFPAKFVICDIGVAPAKGTAIVTFPSFADGMPDERTSVVMKAAAGKGRFIYLYCMRFIGSARFIRFIHCCCFE